ncbi:sphingomyelin phosphodiesterase [Lentinula detonsa]|uniref:Sphingomyelin phosphodiesterase n=1 Tax=Lentinula detonsa TaxID=2804962 RepID=A0AA38UXI7_9AGAR|nr:sphingomyelin phosphodiesterase [Lentinula detonsa]
MWAAGLIILERWTELHQLLSPMALGLLVLSSCLLPSLTLAASSSGFPTSIFTVPGAFPTSIYSKYYNNPTATSAQVQPVISDPVTHEIYPLELTNPDVIATINTKDPHPLPPTASSSKLLQSAIAQVKSIANSTILNGTCAKCIASMEVAKFLALAAPEQGPTFAVELCNFFGFSSTCNATYGPHALGGVVTQVVSNADIGGLDGQMLCQNFLSLCPRPPTTPLNLTGWFAKPKPDPLPAPKTPSGERLKVLHLSDFHLDPRYSTGSEASCSSALCCRANNFNTTSPDTPVFPAPRFGTYSCDSPYALVLSALEAIPVLTDTKDADFDFMLFTGDLVSHDPENENSREFVEYSETVLFDLIKRTLLSGPVYATLGNHDSYSQAQGSPNSLDSPGANQYSWNYDHVSALWEHEGWLNGSAVQAARTHYAAYSVQRSDGLKVISLNTNLWYRPNYFNYINMTNPDVSGMLRMLTDELQESEDAGERVWIIGHVLSGWDGTNPLPNPTNLFYQIVDRYSPHVIANIFWGHTHEDQHSIFYANNATNISAETALAQAWIGPSITPLTNLNSGFRVYEVDSATFEIMDAFTWKSDVNTFPDLDAQLQFGPTYAFEYSTREAYGQNITGWTDSDPLNATWWHLVTEAMEADNSLVTTFNTFQGKESVLSPTCTGDCATAKICYIRSGSASIGLQNCETGFGSVQ